MRSTIRNDMKQATQANYSSKKKKRRDEPKRTLIFLNNLDLVSYRAKEKTKLDSPTLHIQVNRNFRNNLDLVIYLMEFKNTTAELLKEQQ